MVSAMSFDEKAMARASQAQAVLDDCGATDLIADVIRRVWTTNVDRFDPAAGDTTRLLGFESAENLTKLVPGLSTSDDQWRATGLAVSAPNGSLLLAKDGMRFRFVKVAAEFGLRPDWQHGFSWENGSNTRSRSATLNQAVYHPAHVEPGMESLFPLDGLANEGDPSKLNEFFLTWAGVNDEEHRTAGWLCVPSSGERPVLAALPLWFDEPRNGGVSTSAPSAPASDGTAEPEVAIALKKDLGRAGNGRV